jgi:hypothetical protein
MLETVQFRISLARKTVTPCSALSNHGILNFEKRICHDSHNFSFARLRSLDGLNTHDEAFELSVAGGVGTALILPGSANAIGGQAFVVKLRPTAEKSPASMLVEPPFTYNGTGIIPSDPPTWRHLKQACGENPSRGKWHFVIKKEQTSSYARSLWWYSDGLYLCHAVSQINEITTECNHRIAGAFILQPSS